MIIGITGGICSGKSQVSRYWATIFRLSYLNVDAVCRDLLASGASGWLALRGVLPDHFFLADTKEVDRAALRKAVFSDPEIKEKVDSCLHPLVKEEVLSFSADREEALKLIEVPLLFEAGWQDLFDRVVVVYADYDIRLSRLMKRDGVSEQEARLSFSAQIPLEEKVKKSNYIVYNNGIWCETCEQVLSLGRNFMDHTS